MGTNIGSLDLEYVNRIYEEMQEMDVQLDPDPLLFTPTRLANKIALTRSFLSRIQRIWTELSQRQGNLMRQLRKKELVYDLELTRLLAEDPDVMAAPSEGSREAAAKRRLKDLVEEVKILESDIEEVKGLVKVSSSKRTDLKDIQQRIRDQIKLCEEELGLHGRKWGERGPGSVTSDDPSGLFSSDNGNSSGKSKITSDLDDLLEGVEKEFVDPAKSVYQPTSTPEEVDNFFESEDEDGGSEKAPDDFSDIFT